MPEQHPPDGPSVQQFYDGLADEYDLIYADWKQSIQRQSEALDRIIRAELGDSAWSILDCTCGIGTQAIGLATRGHRVRGTDLSPGAISRAVQEAARFGVEIAFSVADIRSLAAHVAGSFDVVLSCDNSMPHLLTDGDLRQAAHAMKSKLRPGGLILASIRDYDLLAADRPRSELPRVIDSPDGRRIVFQVWDWSEDRSGYIVHLFIVRESNGEWKTAHHAAAYRALRRDEFSEFLRQAGFGQIRWRMPEETKFFQPIVTARKA